MSKMEPLTLISATPSPFARMNRIALALKDIPFTLKNEIPWQRETETPKYNPLEKLPILLFPDERKPVYDSTHIQEYIVAKYPDRGPALLTGDVDKDLEIRQIVVLSQGCLDAIVISRFEARREEGKQSKLWMERQMRKVKGAMGAFNELVKPRVEAGEKYLVGNELSIADIAVVCTVTWVDWADTQPGWREEYPVLAKWALEMDERKEFRETRPVMFDLKQDVV